MLMQLDKDFKKSQTKNLMLTYVSVKGATKISLITERIKSKKKKQ